VDIYLDQSWDNFSFLSTKSRNWDFKSLKVLWDVLSLFFKHQWIKTFRCRNSHLKGKNFIFWEKSADLRPENDLRNFFDAEKREIISIRQLKTFSLRFFSKEIEPWVPQGSPVVFIIFIHSISYPDLQLWKRWTVILIENLTVKNITLTS